MVPDDGVKYAKATQGRFSKQWHVCSVDSLRQVAQLVKAEDPDVSLANFTAQTAAFYDWEVNKLLLMST